ncbi:prepilin-type N-terminal cleavage/methylation domain-containing protein [Arenibacter sp. GZD96]|uniref:PulJ/GspJ family protein n=1 Tax=Aurantibrevibacter litoralis TaxID=3106030 RepID=UPI002AFFBE84|nr:prepilin-type N-terminal cleavage/methylation domain-containing protein [Arenibacter sp. GZD-96]MEA1786111.1 prepilin-type N-terminal cleavage/methylation domain-containing protein [Arenibacter sp. GZD-96]
MRIKPNTIPAFTLSEMMVALVITSIVVGMAFAVLQLVQQHMQGIQNNYGNQAQVNLLRQSLWMDLNRYNRVFFDAPQQELFFANEMGTHSYRFEESFIVRDLDTFHLKIVRKAFFFENKEVGQGGIDALLLETEKEFGGQRLFLFKQNSAATYLNDGHGL